MKDNEQEMELGMICVDNIVKTFNKQNWIAFCHIFEALLAYLKRRLPTVKNLQFEATMIVAKTLSNLLSLRLLLKTSTVCT